MTILALADIHGAYKMVERILARETYDMVVVSGDLTTNGTPSEARSALQAIASHGKPVVAVCGNMDPPELEETFEELGVSVNGRCITISGVGFFGVSASPPTTMNTPYEISEEEILERANTGWKNIAGCVHHVFVPHAPPIDTRLDVIRSGRHVGSRSVRECIEQHQPAVAICGHIHEARGIDAIGKTIVVNCGPAASGFYATIELDSVVHAELHTLSRHLNAP